MPILSPKLRAAVLAVLLAVTAPFSLGAQETSTAEEPAAESLGYQEQVDRFFVSLEGGEFGKAMDDLYAGNPWIKPEDLAQARGQFEALPELIGVLHGHEKLSEQHVTDRFVYVWYVGHFDRSPVSLYFKFYKPQDSWRFYSFEYKEDLGQIAREKAMEELKGDAAGDS